MASLYNLITSTLLFLLPLVLLTPAAQGVPETNYNIFVKTGDVDWAGTDSKISLTLYNSTGDFVQIDNLEIWGAMGEGHNYYEKGLVDFFRGKTPNGPLKVCKIRLDSDGTGDRPGWYVDFLSVASNSYYMKFDVNQWLGVEEDPHQLFAEVDNCGSAKLAMVV